MNKRENEHENKISKPQDERRRRSVEHKRREKETVMKTNN